MIINSFRNSALQGTSAWMKDNAGRRAIVSVGVAHGNTARRLGQYQSGIKVSVSIWIEGNERPSHEEPKLEIFEKIFDDEQDAVNAIAYEIAVDGVIERVIVCLITVRDLEIFK